MEAGVSRTVFYRRSHFVTHLPLDYRYTAAHAWVAEQGPGLWRVGLTKFATRMLGEIVDHGFDAALGSAVQPGQVIGWIEGFKAISDLFCAGQGTFLGSNPALQSCVNKVSEDPYGQGWLYSFAGHPGENCVGVQEYRAVLDETIDRILEKQEREQKL